MARSPVSRAPVSRAPGSVASQPRPLRAVADDHEPDAGQVRELGEAAYAVALVQAADVADDDPAALARPGPRPLVVQPLVAQLRGEGAGVDPGLPHGGVEAELGEPAGEEVGGDEQPVGAGGDLGLPESAVSSWAAAAARRASVRRGAGRA